MSPFFRTKGESCTPPIEQAREERLKVSVRSTRCRNSEGDVAVTRYRRIVQVINEMISYPVCLRAHPFRKFCLGHFYVPRVEL